MAGSSQPMLQNRDTVIDEGSPSSVWSDSDLASPTQYGGGNRKTQQAPMRKIGAVSDGIQIYTIYTLLSASGSCVHNIPNLSMSGKWSSMKSRSQSPSTKNGSVNKTIVEEDAMTAGTAVEKTATVGRMAKTDSRIVEAIAE